MIRVAPNCSEYQETLDRARVLVSRERRDVAVEHLDRYLSDYDGAWFDRLMDSEHPNEFTLVDFVAVSKLRVNVLRKARPWLIGEGHAEVESLLAKIPNDKDIWDVDVAEYDHLLGRDSAAWTLWNLIFDQQKGAGRSGRGVTAGKLLHGKRPRLIPIYDDQAVKPALHVTAANVWEALWCTLRHPDIRDRLAEIQASVPSAADLSILRVLDIVTWMSVPR